MIYTDNLIRGVICKWSFSKYQQVLRWMRDAVNDEQPRTCLILRGKQGVGAGVFVGVFGRMFPWKFVVTHRLPEFHMLEDTRLLYLDGGDSPELDIAFNPLISEKELVHEIMGKTPRVLQNFLHVIRSVSLEWTVPAGMDERRFLIMDLSDHRMNDHSYFQKVITEMEDPKEQEKFLDFLKEIK